MDDIIKEGLLPFKEFEKKIYAYVCELGCEITRIMLESYDEELAKSRDRKQYRDKGKRETTIRTVYGNVAYSRHVYQTKTDKGENAYIYLLDEEMHMDKIGLISTNLAEQIALSATEAPYRVAADTINGTTGQYISPMCAWNVIQKLGERIDEEEDFAVNQMNAGEAEGKEGVPVLFEEMDGVWLAQQGEHHEKQPKQEVKVFTMYEGWDANSKDRSKLVNKKILAGMEKSGEFHEKREALIKKTYDADEIGLRVLNGDGGSWIKEPYDDEAIFQLDRFHVYEGIRKKLGDKRAQRDVAELFREQKIDEMLEYIKTYADSVASNDKTDKRSENAMELYQYLSGNRDGLLPYRERGIEIPAPEEGVEYRDMGVQENQNCTVLTLRMKHRRMRWSSEGGNNMVKALYKKENRELTDTIDSFSDGLILTKRMTEITEVLSAAKAPKKDGKGNNYPDAISVHMPILDAMQTASRKVFKEIYCGCIM